MAATLTVMGHNHPAIPQCPQDMLDALGTIPGTAMGEVRLIFKLQRGKRSARIQFGQRRRHRVSLFFQELWVHFIGMGAQSGAFGPITYRDQTCHFIPGVVYDPVGVGRLLPIIHPVARHPRLQDQIRVAPHRIERVILYRTQVIKDARHIRWGKMIGSQKSPGFGA